MDSQATQTALLRQEMEQMKVQLEELQRDVSAIRGMADRWRGGFLVLLSLGGIIGWIASVWDKVQKASH
jgi:hypothetical protein